VAGDDTRVSSALETGQAISWQPEPTSTSVVELARARAARLREQAHLLKSSEQVCVCPRIHTHTYTHTQTHTHTHTHTSTHTHPNTHTQTHTHTHTRLCSVVRRRCIIIRYINCVKMSIIFLCPHAPWQEAVQAIEEELRMRLTDKETDAALDRVGM
jgi:hypothetical protein